LIERIDSATGALLGRQDTADMPDGVIYKACGNRRASVCPHCAEVYRRDAYELIRAGMIGGKGVDTHVSTHPAVFATFTAGSFGTVHTRRTNKNGQPLPCRPRRHPETCPHGVELACREVHDKGAHLLGTPLCLDCYDYDGQAVFNAYASELWRRTTIALGRYLDKLAKRAGLPGVRATCCKVAEMQVRGVVHFHAIIRLDGLPAEGQDPTEVVPPPPGLDVIDLADAIHYAARQVGYTTPTTPTGPAAGTSPGVNRLTCGRFRCGPIPRSPTRWSPATSPSTPRSRPRRPATCPGGSTPRPSTSTRTRTARTLSG
jgi:hypothetical protein